jgi:hypothetical protein
MNWDCTEGLQLRRIPELKQSDGGGSTHSRKQSNSCMLAKQRHTTSRYQARRAQSELLNERFA